MKEGGVLGIYSTCVPILLVFLFYFDGAEHQSPTVRVQQRKDQDQDHQESFVAYCIPHCHSLKIIPIKTRVRAHYFFFLLIDRLIET